MTQDATGDHSASQGPAGNPDEVFARQLRAVRQAAGLTQQQLAGRMNAAGTKMHRSAVAKIEAGDRPVSVGEAVRFAAVLGVSLDELVTEPGPDTAPRPAGAQAAVWPLLDLIAEVRKLLEEHQAHYGAAADKFAKAELRLGELGLELRPVEPPGEPIAIPGPPPRKDDR